MLLSSVAQLTPSPADVRFATPRYYLMRRVWGALGEAPRTQVAIAAELGAMAIHVSGALERLIEARLALRLDRRGYVRRGPARPMWADAGLAPEVGRRILLHLTEPRRTRDIARHIGRSGSCTTAHLRHLLRRGLAVRLDWGVYALPGPVPVDSAAPVRRHREIPGRVLALLEQERRTAELASLLPDISRPRLDNVLAHLRQSGAVTWVGRGRHVRADAVPPEARPPSGVGLAGAVPPARGLVDA